MEGEMLKGHLDMIVLAALSAAGPAHGYAVIEQMKRRRVRSARGDDLPRAASSRAGGPAQEQLDDRRLRAAAAGLHTDPSRQSCADRAPRGLETIFRCHWRSAWRNPATGEPGMIPDYLERLARELSFDRSLARNVRQEVENHLWEADAADPTGNMLAAQQRAIANFGDARAIAAQFAAISLARYSRRAGAAAVLVIASVFIAMKARIAWNAAAQLAIGEDMRAVSGLVVLIDRYAFWLSVIIGLGGWAYIVSRRIPAGFYPAHRKQLRRFFVLCCAAAAALVVSVISDGVLTALLLRGTELSAGFLVPVFSMAIEIVCVGILVFHIRGITRRAASTAALLNT